VAVPLPVQAWQRLRGCNATSRRAIFGKVVVICTPVGHQKKNEKERKMEKEKKKVQGSKILLMALRSAGQGE
jgi:hypothetical protein